MSITNTYTGGFIFVAKPKNGGYTWLYKWGDFEDVIDKKVSDAGFGGENVERTLDDGFIINGPTPLYGAKIETFHDHRIAMAFAIAGLVAHGKMVLDHPECASISYPEFYDELERMIQ